jgi:hypothetical protein
VDRWNISRDAEHHTRPICGAELGHTRMIKMQCVHTEVKIKKIRKNSDNNSETRQWQSNVRGNKWQESFQ